ncbi:MAG: hypothetical protein IJ608_05550 [Lachnospiraceae bacterium]|nr:hypothetical protein [Lachnospiraceae bacterium]
MDWIRIVTNLIMNSEDGNFRSNNRALSMLIAIWLAGCILLVVCGLMAG